jgi:hypothetical protein
MSGSGFGGIYTVGNYTDYRTIAMLANSGHLRITVTPDVATVEYVRSNTTGVSYTYTIAPNAPPPLVGDFSDPADCDVDGSDLAWWIAYGPPQEMDIDDFAENFGKNSCQ